MEKKNIFVLGIILVGILVSLYFVFYYNLENNEDYVQSYCESWAERVGVVRPACVGFWVREDGECSWVCEGGETDGAGECVGVSQNELQECCDNWAEENDIFRIQCVGQWEIENNSCSWVCD